MRRFMFAIVAVGVVFAAGVSYAQETTSAEQELIRLANEMVNAILKRDVASLGRLWADDVTHGTPDGMSISKDQALGAIESGVYVATSMTHDNLKVRVYGSTAVISGLNTEKSQLMGSDTSGQYLFTDTWIKRDGRWQCVATHLSEVAETTDDSQEPSPELKKLEGLVGVWAYEGEQADPPVAGLPYGGAGKYFGTLTNRFVLDGLFMEEKIEDNNPSGRTSIVTLMGYDAKAGKYTESSFISDGSSSVATATLDGRTWTSNSTMTTSEGKKVLLRSMSKYSSDWSSSTATTEVSPDNGKTWKLWYKDEGRKVKTDTDEQESGTKSGSLLGTWEQVSYKYGSMKEFSDSPKSRRRIKMITDTHSLWFDIDTSTEEIRIGAGGSYSLIGDTYTESKDFSGEGMKAYAGKKHVYTVQIESDKFIQSGALSDGLKIAEVWRRIK